MTNAERCVVCDAPLTPRDALTRPTCGARACRWTHQSTPAHDRCRVCARPLGASERAARLCATAACRQQVLRDVRERRQREWNVLVAQAHAIRNDGAASAGVADAAAYPVTAVTGRRTTPTPVSRERRRAYRARLATLIGEAVRRRDAGVPYDEAPYEPEPVTDDLAYVLGAACTLCSGGCCRGGANHAYLAIDTLRRWLDAHPAARPRDALRAYLERVPAVSLEHSCINHTERGCALPRELRSDTCNRFFCGALVALTAAVAGGRSPRTFVAAESDGVIEAAGFVEPRRLRVVYEREPAAPA